MIPGPCILYYLQFDQRLHSCINTVITNNMFRHCNVKHAKKSYVGQTGRSLAVRHREHTRYVKTNNPLSAYAMHILNKHDCGYPEHTLQLLQACEKGKLMNCWESLHMQIRQQHLLIDEQRTNDFNSLYSLANVTHHTTQFHNRSVDTGQSRPRRQQRWVHHISQIN